MSVGASHPAPRERRGALALCAFGFLLYALSRALHPIQGLGNPDIAGILYEADLIHEGLLPYRDTADFKSPGAFFLLAGVFRFVSRDLWAIKLAYFAWALLAAPAVWIAGRALYGRDGRGTLAAGGAVLLYLLSIGLFDFNYSAWMTPAYAWAFAALLVGLGGRPRWHLAAGACAGLAFLLKTHALVLGPAFVTVWGWSRRRGDPGATWAAWPLWLAGALAAASPLVGLYAAHEALPDLLRGLFPIEDAVAYTARIVPEEHWVWLAVWKVSAQFVRAFPVQAGLCAAALIAAGLAWRRGGAGPKALPVAPQLSLLAWSVVGCGLGGLRYYVHYLPQYLPAVALLAAHPAGLGWLLRRPERGRLLRRVPALLLLGWVVVKTGQHLGRLVTGKAARYDYRSSAEARRLGARIEASTRPDECVQVWGWAAWPVYYWSHRRACSPEFKVLGHVTEMTQNSLLTHSYETDLQPGPHADGLLRSFQERPPAFFVRTAPFFPGVRRDPLDQFTALRAIIERDYVLRWSADRIYVYERVDRLPPEEQEEVRRKKAASPARPR